ncbi:unnamed protein product [Paramecium octaurelia]|uniref:Uncharacterized protein n=1 Tax=Paramecium octaurelia TaxID=43137 RepID=A0A8S1UES0_PAROT|nr:unnamed protein product [Paramecium octaurelia]
MIQSRSPMLKQLCNEYGHLQKLPTLQIQNMKGIQRQFSMVCIKFEVLITCISSKFSPNHTLIKKLISKIKKFSIRSVERYKLSQLTLALVYMYLTSTQFDALDHQKINLLFYCNNIVISEILESLEPLQLIKSSTILAGQNLACMHPLFQLLTKWSNFKVETHLTYPALSYQLLILHQKFVWFMKLQLILFVIQNICCQYSFHKQQRGIVINCFILSMNLCRVYFFQGTYLKLSSFTKRTVENFMLKCLLLSKSCC